jgi:hypothetical protein
MLPPIKFNKDTNGQTNAIVTLNFKIPLNGQRDNI